jgi:hypothetical protein
VEQLCVLLRMIGGRNELILLDPLTFLSPLVRLNTQTSLRVVQVVDSSFLFRPRTRRSRPVRPFPIFSLVVLPFSLPASSNPPPISTVRSHYKPHALAGFSPFGSDEPNEFATFVQGREAWLSNQELREEVEEDLRSFAEGSDFTEVRLSSIS